MVEKRNERVGATARVTVTIEIDADSSWGSGCTIDQIRDQAIESAMGRLRKAIAATIPNDPEEKRPRPIRIIGEPTVAAVIVERER